MQACLLLFRYCLEELQKNNNDDLDTTDESNNNSCNYSLLSYATDETVKHIWLQCLDTGELLRDVLVSLHLSTSNQNYHLPMDLHQISSVDNSKFIQCVVNILTTLVQLSRIPSNPELLTDLFVYDSTDKPLRGDMVCKWLKQMCCIHMINSQGFKLINNCLLNTLFFDTKDNLQKMNLITWFLSPGGLFQFFVGDWISSLDSFSVNQPSLCIEYMCIVIKIWIMYHKWSDLFTCNVDDRIKASLINFPDELLNRIDKILSLFEAASSNSSVEYHVFKFHNACTEAAKLDIRFLDISVLVRDI
ncbi:hypothetical protein KSF78_0004154 [Schistosoma japonicum]|nr:hypothetical protein KSF78_0004154 [Schistosoma japonicum]